MGYVKVIIILIKVCDKTCYSCVNSPTSCTWCVYNRYLVLDQCYCIDGFYENNLRDCICKIIINNRMRNYMFDLSTISK